MTPAPAYAGAWIAPKGGQTISTEIAGARDEVFYSESSIYVEAPASDDLSVVVAPWVTQESQQSGLESLRWEITLAGKWATHRGARSGTAFQGGLVWNSDPLADCAEAQAELRWLGGRTLGRRGLGFANLEIAERAGDGGCGGERLDATLGYRL